MDKIVCFGELLLRFSPFDGCFEENYMPVYIGGAELNVCTALSRWGMPVKYVTALPDNYLSKEIVGDIGKRNIDASSIIFGGKRTGIYYLQQGTDLKNAGVIYDRTGSSFYDLRPGEVDWQTVLAGADWFHFSAISPALNDHAVSVCEEALKAAREKKIRISVDLNYRAKLWQYGKKPVEVMPKLVSYSDVVMGNLWAAETMLGIAVPGNIRGDEPVEHLREMAHLSATQLVKEFPSASIVANTFRFDTQTGIRYSASLYRNEKTYSSQEFRSEHIVDKVGSGDCFMAGLIYGIKKKSEPQRLIDFAAAAAFAKMHEKGDSTKNSAESINKIIQHG